MSKGILEAVLGHRVEVRIVLGPLGDHTDADYGRGVSRIRFNLRARGRRWFETDNLAAQLDLLIHEAAHDRVSDHMSEAYYKECTRMGAGVAVLALSRRDLFSREDAVA